MKTKTCLLMITLAFALTGISNGQNVGNYLKRKANMAGNHATNRADQNVNNKINGEVDKKVDNAFNKLWGDDKKKTDDENQDQSSGDSSSNSSSSPSQNVSNASNKAASNAMMKAMGISANVKVNDSYDYTGNLITTVQSWDGDGSTEGEVLYTTYVNKDNTGFAMEFSQPEKGKTIMIFDYKEGRMIIMGTEGNDKTGMVMQWQGMTDSLDSKDFSQPPTDAEIEDFSKYNEHLVKTGNSKRIAGYKCDEYTYDDEESHATLWMTDELPPELWANMFSTNTYTAASMGFYGGFVMQMDSKEKNSGERTTMLVNEVNLNQSKSISTKGYQFMSLGSGAMNQKSSPQNQEEQVEEK